MSGIMKWRFGLKEENVVLLLLIAILIGATTGCLAVGFRFLLLSGRRWLNLGFFKTTIINQIVIAAYFMGVSPARIALWYQNKKEEG